MTTKHEPENEMDAQQSEQNAAVIAHQDALRAEYADLRAERERRISANRNTLWQDVEMRGIETLFNRAGLTI